MLVADTANAPIVAKFAFTWLTYLLIPVIIVAVILVIVMIVKNKKR